MSVMSEARQAAGRRSLWQNELARGVILQVLAAAIVLALTAFFVHNTTVNLRQARNCLGLRLSRRHRRLRYLDLPDPLQAAVVYWAGLLRRADEHADGVGDRRHLGHPYRLRRRRRPAVAQFPYREAGGRLCRHHPQHPAPGPDHLLVFRRAGGASRCAAESRFSQSEVLFLNTRGLYMPAPILQPGFWILPAALVVGLIATFIVRRWAHRRQELTGQQFPTFWTGLALIIGLPLLVGLVAGFHMTFSLPVLKGFNFAGGMVVLPEFVAILLSLSIYTGAFIAEIVRGGVQAISHGQTEAAYALGLRPSQSTRLVILPQAFALSSRRYQPVPEPDQELLAGRRHRLSRAGQRVHGTALNQTGQAVETITITMGVYLSISLAISAVMNWYNRQIALVER